MAKTGKKGDVFVNFSRRASFVSFLKKRSDRSHCLARCRKLRSFSLVFLYLSAAPSCLTCLTPAFPQRVRPHRQLPRVSTRRRETPTCRPKSLTGGLQRSKPRDERKEEGTQGEGENDGMRCHPAIPPIKIKSSVRLSPLRLFWFFFLSRFPARSSLFSPVCTAAGAVVLVFVPARLLLLLPLLSRLGSVTPLPPLLSLFLSALFFLSALSVSLCQCLPYRVLFS